MNQRNNIIGVKPIKKAYGNVRRENLSKEIMYKEPIFPKTVEYNDIDAAMAEWVDKKINIVYDGIKLPTYNSLTTQRFSEYSQTWQYTDESDSPIMNFKTYTRDVNPTKGTINSNTMNIPGERLYEIARIPIKQDNSVDCYDIYQMKQPFGVDLSYKVSIFTNKFELMNEMNTKVHDLFKAIECYIRVNGHYMCLLLDGVDDESVYSLNEKKFYSQTFNIKCLAYIITENDFKIDRIPKRLLTIVECEKSINKARVIIEENEDETLNLVISYPKYAKNVTKFKIDEDITITSVKTTNISSYKIERYDSRELINTNEEFNLKENEKLRIEINKIDYLKEGILELIGLNSEF